MKTPVTQKFDPEKERIPHPYKVPDNFFNEFKKELLDNISEETNTKKSRIIQLFKKSLQYAAILAFSFFAVKGIGDITRQFACQLSAKDDACLAHAGRATFAMRMSAGKWIAQAA